MNETTQARQTALDSRPRPISVRMLFRRKNAALARRIPTALFLLLERIAHSRELSAFLQDAHTLSPMAALELAVRELGLTWRVTGAPLPASGDRLTIVANHPHGGADAIILLHLLMRSYGAAQVPANDLVQVLAPLAPLFVPVNKHGSNHDHFRRLDAVFADSKPLLIFPAGRTGRPAGADGYPDPGGFSGGRLHQNRGAGRRPIVDYPWTRTFVKKSRAHGRTIVPVHIAGRNSRRFYAIAWMRARLRIRLNLEMLLLVDELARQRGRHFRLTVGKPIDARRLDRSRSDDEWAGHIRRYVHALGRGETSDFFTWLTGQRPHGGAHELD
ncbi:MAG: hypothetical protein EA403_16000 [Spirochaetaceae bacterium]|nr:MAG: hypothetical protein EA403_16000 [Spirochaetaceae bacterium]